MSIALASSSLRSPAEAPILAPSSSPTSDMAALTAPGLWLQRVTTKEPSDEMAAVAIHALDGAMQLEKAQGGELVIA